VSITTTRIPSPAEWSVVRPGSGTAQPGTTSGSTAGQNPPVPGGVIDTMWSGAATPEPYSDRTRSTAFKVSCCTLIRVTPRMRLRSTS
jgi:hypothetical protein